MNEKCFTCKKKLPLLPFVCKCNNSFCSKHKYPEDHNCDFNYKLFVKMKLEKDNPTVVNDKLINRI